jgi:hypothetical protein
MSYESVYVTLPGFGPQHSYLVSVIVQCFNKLELAGTLLVKTSDMMDARRVLHSAFQDMEKLERGLGYSSIRSQVLNVMSVVKELQLQDTLQRVCLN